MSERLQRLLQELNLDSVLAPDAGKQEDIEILSRCTDAFAIDHTDIGQTTLLEHQIEKGNSITVSQRAEPIPKAGRTFVEAELQPLFALHFRSAADPGAWPNAGPIGQDICRDPAGTVSAWPHCGHSGRHRTTSRGLTIPYGVPRFRRGGPVPIKIGILQLDYYFCHRSSSRTDARNWNDQTFRPGSFP